MTLCMECAYLDNLKAAHIVEQDGELQRLMAENALKNVGAHDQYVARKLRFAHVRAICHKWLWLARSSLLHDTGADAQAARVAYKLLLEREAAREVDRQGHLEVALAAPGAEQVSGEAAATPAAAAKEALVEAQAAGQAVEESDSLTVSSVDLAGSINGD